MWEVWKYIIVGGIALAIVTFGLYFSLYYLFEWIDKRKQSKDLKSRGNSKK